MQKRAIETQSKILTTAIREFSEKGFHGTTVDDISARAGVNKQRIYAYYQNKENLFGEVLKESFAKIIAAEGEFLELIDADIPRLAEILTRHYFEFHLEHPEFWRLIAWENLEGGKHVTALKGVRNQTFSHLASLYQKGQGQGIYDPEVSFETFIFMVSAYCFFYFSNLRTMAQTLNLDLAAAAVRERLIQEGLRLIQYRREK